MRCNLNMSSQLRRLCAQAHETNISPKEVVTNNTENAVVGKPHRPLNAVSAHLPFVRGFATNANPATGATTER